MDLNKVISVMEMAAINAGDMLIGIQSKSKRLETRKDFLTDADIKSEEIILRALASEYPDIPSFSEEKGGEVIKNGYLWIVDPVDGTINFFLQDDHWGISIALVENGYTIAGVVYLPTRKQIFSASRDISARFRHIEEIGWTNIEVNKENNLANSQFWIGWGKEKHEGNDHKAVYNVIEKLDRQTLYPQIRNSAVADMMMVARGKIMGYVFTNPEPFDIAAAGFIIERAGGKVTDMNGNPWNPFSQSLVASNSIIYNDLMRIIKL